MYQKSKGGERLIKIKFAFISIINKLKHFCNVDITKIAKSTWQIHMLYFKVRMKYEDVPERNKSYNAAIFVMCKFRKY